MNTKNERAVVMRTRNAQFGMLGLAVCGVAFASVVFAQQGDRRSSQQQTDTAQQAPDMDAMMQEWMKYSEPDEHHKLMEPMVGSFTAVAKMWMDPTSSEPTVSNGTMESKWVLGGRFIKQHYISEFMGMPFEGIGMWGYDRYQERYTGYWWDTFGTTTYESKGSVNESGTTFTMYGVMQDPAQDGRLVRTRDVTRVINNDKHVMEMHHDLPDGSWMKVMEITFTRANSS